MLRRTLSKVLREAGYRVTALADVPAGPAAGEVQPQLIVLGTRVLDAAALAATHRLRELEPVAPILAVADRLDSRYADAAPLPHGSRCLAPPFDLPDLLRAVQSELEHR